MGSFEYFDHAADIGVHIRGVSLPDLFLTGAQALMDRIGTAPDRAAAVQLEVQVEADGLDELLVRWLQEVLYAFHQRHAYLIGAESIDFRGGRLSATINAKVWEEDHALDYQEVKAVTYHHLELCRDGSGWRASIILDI